MKVFIPQKLTGKNASKQIGDKHNGITNYVGCVVKSVDNLRKLHGCSEKDGVK